MKHATNYSETMILQHREQLIDTIILSLFDMVEGDSEIDVKISETSKISYIEAVYDEGELSEVILTEQYMDEHGCTYSRPITIGKYGKPDYDGLSMDILFAVWNDLNAR